MDQDVKKVLGEILKRRKERSIKPGFSIQLYRLAQDLHVALVAARGARDVLMKAGCAQMAGATTDVAESPDQDLIWIKPRVTIKRLEEVVQANSFVSTVQ